MHLAGAVKGVLGTPGLQALDRDRVRARCRRDSLYLELPNPTTCLSVEASIPSMET